MCVFVCFWLFSQRTTRLDIVPEFIFINSIYTVVETKTVGFASISSKNGGREDSPYKIT